MISTTVINEQINKMRKFLMLVFLIVIGRLYDGITTFLYTPDLSKESNIIIKYLGAGWTSFIILQIVLIGFVIYLIYYFIFKYNPQWPTEKKLTFKQFASYLFFNNTHSFYKILYKTPQNKNVLFAFVGYVTSLTLISVSYIVGASTTFLLISNPYRNFYKNGMTEVGYGLMGVIAIFFTIRFFKTEFKKYENSRKQVV